MKTPRVRKPKPPRVSEHVHAVHLMTMVGYSLGLHPELAELFAVPNGGDRHPAVASKMKAEGVKKGVHDYLLLVPRGPFHGMTLELKALDDGPSPEQLAWQRIWLARGYHSVVCRGAQAAFDALVAYLKQGT